MLSNRFKGLTRANFAHRSNKHLWCVRNLNLHPDKSGIVRSAEVIGKQLLEFLGEICTTGMELVPTSEDAGRGKGTMRYFYFINKKEAAEEATSAD